MQNLKTGSNGGEKSVTFYEKERLEFLESDVSPA